MLTVRVRIRNAEAQAQGLPVLAQLKIQDQILEPGEEREFEFTEEDDLKIKARLTEAGEEMKKAIEEADKAVAEDRKEDEKIAKGEKKDLNPEQRAKQKQENEERLKKLQEVVQRQIPGGAPPVSPGPKIETGPPSHGGARDSHDVKGQPQQSTAAQRAGETQSRR